MLTYNQHGQSRGVATVVFNNMNAANEALKMNGLTVDKESRGPQLKVRSLSIGLPIIR